MKIGIMSDSHDNIENVKKSIQLFKTREVDLVFHLGDFVNPNSVRAMKGMKFIAIFGNNDGDKFRMIDAFRETGGEIKGEFYDCVIDGIKFACYHGTEPQLKDALIECGKYDVVVYGHTHECEDVRIGNTLVLNPGTVHGFGGNATVIIFDTENKKSEFLNLQDVR